MLERAPKWKVIYTHRLANCAAHALFTLACLLSHDVVWMEECLDQVLDVVLEDKLCIGLFD